MKLASAKVHFIGIGGIGMCGLAELLRNMGATVTGSDLGENAQTARLKNIGITIAIGHSESNIGEAEVVVYSSAVKPSNVEYQAARTRGIPLIARAEALAEIMRLKRGIAIAGSHGKTTTTSLAASVFLEAKLDPTIVVGGRLDVIKSTAQLGKGEWLIAEADESDGSFNRLSPEVVVVTNVDNDHLDHYKTFSAIQDAFYDFALRIPFYGSLIACGDDAINRTIFMDFPKRVIFYGFDAKNEYRLEGEKGFYRVFHENRLLGTMDVPMPGRHNAVNALAAVISGLLAGIDFKTCVDAIAKFRGVDRRFQFKKQKNGIDYYDDYGHHPTEIAAVLNAFKEKFPERRVFVVFQPHRYSRTQSCWQEFLTCFKNSHRLYLLDIYAAGEAPIDGISSKILSQQVQHDNCSFAQSRAEVIEKIQTELQPGDIFLSLGAGDVWKLGEALYS